MKIKPVRLLSIFFITLIVAIGVRYFFATRERVPHAFMDARIKGAEIAHSIATLSNDMLGELDEIARHDRIGNRVAALDLVGLALIKNRSTQEEAVRLSVELEKMARHLSDIQPARARELATAAVGAEVALVSRLVTYNNLLNQLFNVLRDKFAYGAYTNGTVPDLVARINEEAQAINELDARFNEAINEFDAFFNE